MSGPVAIPPRPVVAQPQAWEFPEPRLDRLSNGARVRSFHLPGQHVVAVRLGLPGPLAGEPAGQEGLGLLVARCLDAGTTRRDAEELAEEFERRGIALGGAVGERGLFVDLDLIGAHLPDGLALLSECVTDAAFPDEEVYRQIRTRQAEIVHEGADASSRAATTFLAAHYDARDRASLPIGGTSATLARIDVGAVRQHHQRLLGAGPVEIAVAGDLSSLDLIPLLDHHLGHWPAASSEPAREPAREPALDPVLTRSHAQPQPASRVAADAARVILVERPSSVQTELYLGRQAPGRCSAVGWGIYQLLSLIFGGSAQSRLDRELRVKRGLTYGISAGFRARADGGLFVVGGAVREEVAPVALEAVVTTLDVPGSSISSAELARASDYLGRTAPARYVTADVVAAEALGLAMEGLPNRFVTDNLREIAEAEPDVVAAAWDANRTEPWTVVLVGRVHQWAGQIEQLSMTYGLGPVELVSIPE